MSRRVTQAIQGLMKAEERKQHWQAAMESFEDEVAEGIELDAAGNPVATEISDEVPADVAETAPEEMIDEERVAEIEQTETAIQEMEAVQNHLAPAVAIDGVAPEERALAAEAMRLPLFRMGYDFIQISTESVHDDQANTQLLLNQVEDRLQQANERLAALRG